MSGTQGFLVANEPCDQCLFTPGRIVSGTRMAEVLRLCSRNDSHFICHKASIDGKDICCRGFYDAGLSSNWMRVCGRLGYLRFVDLPGASA